MSGLSIDTTVPITDGTVVDVPYSFAIKATAKGGFVQWKAVNSKIVVCGSEIISKIDAEAFTKTLDIVPTASAFTTDAEAMFSTNDAHCPPISLHVKLDDTTLA